MDSSINPALLHLGTQNNQNQNHQDPYLDADYLTDMSLVGDPTGLNNNGAGEISIAIHPAEDDDDIPEDHFASSHHANGSVGGLGSPPYSGGFGGDDYGGNGFDNYNVPMSTEDFGFTELTMNTPPHPTSPLPTLETHHSQASGPSSPLIFHQGTNTPSDYGSPQLPSTPASTAFLMGTTNPTAAADVLGHSLDGGVYLGAPISGGGGSHSPMQPQYIEGLGFIPGTAALGQLNTSGPFFHPSPGPGSNPPSSVHSHSPSGSVDYSSSSHGRVSPVNAQNQSPSLTSPTWVSATFNTNTPPQSLLAVPGRGHARRHSSSDVYHAGSSSPGSSTTSLPFALSPTQFQQQRLHHGHTRGGHSLDMQHHHSDMGAVDGQQQHLMRPDLIPLPISAPSSLLTSPFLDDDLPLPPDINPADLNFGAYSQDGQGGYRRSMHVRRHSGSGYTHNISGRGRSPIRGGTSRRHAPYPSPSHSPTPSFRDYNPGAGAGNGNGFDAGNTSYEMDLSLGGGPNRSRAPSAAGSNYGGGAGGRHSRAPSASGSNYGGEHSRQSSVGHGRRSRSGSRVAGDDGPEGDEDRDGPIIKETITTDATHAAALSRRKSNGKEQKLFQCRVCGQEMTAKHNLKRHEDAHYGIKAFQCSWCDRALTTNADLKRHQKTCKKNPDLLGQPPPPLNIVQSHGSAGVGSPPLGVGSPPGGVGSPYSGGVGSPFGGGVGSPGANSLGAPSPADSHYGASSPGGTSYGAPSPGSVNDEGSPVPS